MLEINELAAPYFVKKSTKIKISNFEIRKSSFSKYENLDKKRIKYLKFLKLVFFVFKAAKKNEINKILFSPLLTCHCSRGKDCALAWARVTQLAFGKGHFRKIQQPRFLPILRFQTRRLRRFLGLVRELVSRNP